MIMKVKTTDLSGPALDWAVAKAQGRTEIKIFGRNQPSDRGWVEVRFNPEPKAATARFDPTENWSQGGPIIEREGIYLRSNDTVTEWAAGALRKNRLDKKPGPLFYAKTPLIAAMRCFVASRLGDEVDIPEELL